MHRVGAAAEHELPVTLVIAAPEKADAGELILRSFHEVMAPESKTTFALFSRAA